MPKRSSPRIVLLAGALGALAGDAHAEDRATAQQLFEEARSLMARGNLAEACPKFEGATRLVSTPGVRLNLADCYEQSGKFASAWAAFEDAEAAAQRIGDAAAAREAGAGKKRVAPKRSFLVVAAASPEIPGLEVKRDGIVVPKVAWEAATPADAGEHVIEATAPGHKPWSIRIAVPSGAGRARAVVPALEAEPTPPAAAPATAAAPPAGAAPRPALARDASPSGGGATRTLGWVSLGVGAVGLGAGTFFALRSHGKRAEADDLCPGGACHASSPEAADALRGQLDGIDADATSAGKTAAIALGVGAAGVIGGVTLLVLAGKSSAAPRPDASAITPWIGPGAIGASGRF